MIFCPVNSNDQNRDQPTKTFVNNICSEKSITAMQCVKWCQFSDKVIKEK